MITTRKSLLLLIALGFGSCATFAQTQSTMSSFDVQFPSIGDTSIVRHWNDNYMISYFENDGLPYLCMTSLYYFSNGYSYSYTDSVKLADYIRIKDMYVLDAPGELLFCGTIYDTVGMCGYFRLFPFYHNYYDNYNIYKLDAATSLKKLIAIRDTLPGTSIHTPRIVAIGEKRIGNNSLDCIVEIPDCHYSSNGAYKYAYLFQGNERIDDLVLADSRVAFITRAAVEGEGPWGIRLSYISDVLGYNSPIDTRWIPINLEEHEVMYRTHSTHMRDDTIAISYVSRDYGNYLMKERIVDIRAMTTNLSAMESKQTVIPYPDEIRETKFFPELGILAVLWPTYYSVSENKCRVLLFKPTPASLNTAKWLISPDDNYYYSIDRLFDDVLSVMYRGEYLLQRINPMNYFNKSCWKESDHNIVPIESSRLIPIPKPFYQDSSQRTLINVFPIRGYFNKDENCVITITK